MNVNEKDEQLLVRFQGGRFNGDHYAMRSTLGWPPPPELEMGDQRYVRQSFSNLTDEKMEGAEHLIRGAVYRFSPDAEVP